MRNPDGQGSIAQDAFEFVPAPAISSFTPTDGGPAGGREIEIIGSDFRGGTVVLFDGLVVQPDLVFDNRIVVVSPALPVGTSTITIRDEHGQTATAATSFTVLDVPSNELTSVAPDPVLAMGGQTVTVTGTDFVGTSEFTLGGDDLSATVLGPTSAEFESVPRAPVAAELSVVDQYGQRDVLTVDVAGFTENSGNLIPAPVSGGDADDGWRATRILTGDLDDDGDDDLVLVRPAVAFGSTVNRSRVRILLWNSATSAFVDGTSGLPAVTADDDWRANDAVLADLDGDDDLDLAIVRSTADPDDEDERSSLRVLLNNGSAAFTDVTDTSLPDNTSAGDHNHGIGLAAIDVDGDTVLDLVVTNTEPFEETLDLSPPPPEPPPDPPDPPILVTYYYPGTRVLQNDGNAVFTRDPAAMPAVDENDAMQFEGDALATGDIDGDGDDDVLVTRDDPLEDPGNPGTYLRAAQLLRNDGGTFVDVSAAQLPAASGAEYLQGDRAYFADLDDDGDLDLVIASDTALVAPGGSTPETTQALRVFLNTSGTFAAPATSPFPGKLDDDVLQSTAAAFGDLDGDGDTDVLLISTAAPNVGERSARLLRQNDDGTFTRAGLALPDRLLDDGRGAAANLLDVDDDGDLDVLIGRDEPFESVRNTRVFRNDRLE